MNSRTGDSVEAESACIAQVVGNMVLEIYAMVAMLVYALIAWAVERMVWLIFYRSR